MSTHEFELTRDEVEAIVRLIGNADRTGLSTAESDLLVNVAAYLSDELRSGVTG